MNDNKVLYTDSQVFSAKIDETTGFLTAPVVLARTGIQQYMGYELGLKDREMEKINVFRSPEEVFNEESVKSYINLVATDDHPVETVTCDNVKKFQKGQVSEVKKNKNTLVGICTVTDKRQIEKIKNGKVEVSVGYFNDLKEEKGIFDNEKYEYIQTNIRANHLAFVDAGRCGEACKITIDQKKEYAMAITIDGIQYKIEDPQLVQALEKQIKTFDAEMEKMKKKLTEEEEEKKKLQKEKDEAEAKKDAMEKEEKEKTSDEAIESQIADRVSLIVQAEKILGDKMPKERCPCAIKKAVINHVLKDMELEEKSDDYIAAAYDMAVKKHEKGKKTLDNLEKDFLKDKDGKEITRDSAREKYIKDQLKIKE